MAFNFDLNSALAGAKTVSELVNAPREMAMKEQMQAEQIASSQQQRALAGQQLEASKFDLGQKQAVATREGEMRGLQQQQGDVVAQIKEKNRALDAIANDSAAPARERLSAFASKSTTGSGAIAAVKSGKLPQLIEDANYATQTYSQLMKDPQSVTPEQKQGLLDSLGVYYGAYQREFNPDTFKATFDDSTHKITITAKDAKGNTVPVDTIDNPSDAVKMYTSDINELRGVHDALTTQLAAKGDPHAQEVTRKFFEVLDEKDNILKQRDALAKVAPPHIQDMLAGISGTNKEEAQQILKEAVTAIQKYKTSKANAPLTTELEKVLATVTQSPEFRKLDARGKSEYMADYKSQFITYAMNNPAVIAAAKSATMPIEDAAKLAYDYKDAVNTYTKLAELDIKKQTADASVKQASAAYKQAVLLDKQANFKTVEEAKDHAAFTTALQKQQTTDVNNIMDKKIADSAVQSTRNRYMTLYGRDPVSYKPITPPTMKTVSGQTGGDIKTTEAKGAGMFNIPSSAPASIPVPKVAAGIPQATQAAKPPLTIYQSRALDNKQDAARKTIPVNPHDGDIHVDDPTYGPVWVKDTPSNRQRYNYK